MITNCCLTPRWSQPPKRVAIMRVSFLVRESRSSAAAQLLFVRHQGEAGLTDELFREDSFRKFRDEAAAAKC